MEYTEGGVRKIVDGKVLYDFTENSTITVDDGDYAGNDAFSNPAILGSKNTTININVAGEGFKTRGGNCRQPLGRRHYRAGWQQDDN